MKLIAVIPVLAAVCLVSSANAQKVTRPPKTPAAPHSQQPAPIVTQSRPQQSAENPPASPLYLERLLKLTPEQRNKALSSLPPARRAQILTKLESYQKIPPQQRAMELEKLERLQKLPPQKRVEVRASLKKFQAVPQPRQRQIRAQINQMKNLSDADRRSLMNSEEFRSKYTPAEQQMIGDISLVESRP